MSEHTKEPWALEGTDDGLVLEGHERGPMDEEYICLLTDISKSDARRIVACVNACAGIETETLEADGSIAGIIRDKRSKISTLKAQHDELLAAAKRLSSERTMGLAFLEAWNILRAAIANAEERGLDAGDKSL